jgi:glycosyltransferase involved in cell wall biosynthesis
MKHLKNKSIRMLAIGDRSHLDFPSELAYKNQLLEIAEEEGVADRVVFKSFMSNPANGFAALDCFVMASNEETFGMVTLEAMAAGTPVVGADCYGTAGLVQNGKNGYLFETDNPLSLAQQIDEVFQSPEKLEGIKTYAQRYVLDGFQHDSWVERLVEVFEG